MEDAASKLLLVPAAGSKHAEAAASKLNIPVASMQLRQQGGAAPIPYANLSYILPSKLTSLSAWGLPESRGVCMHVEPTACHIFLEFCRSLGLNNCLMRTCAGFAQAAGLLDVRLLRLKCFIHSSICCARKAEDGALAKDARTSAEHRWPSRSPGPTTPVAMTWRCSCTLQARP